MRKATRDIADEAVIKVYEYGAGSPRGGDYEKDRFELARRFRRKYRSGDDLSSNVAPHFIGVFDTVASLGATGPKWWGIAAGLTILAVLVAAVPAVLSDLAFGTGYWRPFLATLSLTAAFVLWRWLPTAVKTITDSPVNGKARWHIAQWRSGNYDQLLSGHVGYARHALSIDETRADFPRVRWGSRDGVRKKVQGEPDPLIQMWFAGNHSDIGGSYPEAESRLSDVALQWMGSRIRFGSTGWCPESPVPAGCTCIRRPMACSTARSPACTTPSPASFPAGCPVAWDGWDGR